MPHRNVETSRDYKPDGGVGTKGAVGDDRPPSAKGSGMLIHHSSIFTTSALLQYRPQAGVTVAPPFFPNHDTVRTNDSKIGRYLSVLCCEISLKLVKG
jgi:hypothetical protein